MYYLQRKFPLVRRQAAQAELKKFISVGASIHQRSDSHYFDLLIPIDQQKADRQFCWYERTYPGMFMLVRVDTFDPDAGVVSVPVASAANDQKQEAANG